MAGTTIDVGGSVGGNVISGDKNLVMQVSGDLIFNAAEYSERRKQRDLRKMLRVLVVLAAPVSDPSNPAAEPAPLDLQEEWNRLAAAVQASGAPIALIRLAPPTLEALRFALSPRAVEQGLYPHVLHFSGHAWSGGLLLEDEYSQSDPVSTPRLLAALKDAPPLDLAVFNACESAEGAFSAAQAFAANGRARAALGHPEPVRDDEAVQFAAALYAEMARGGYALGEAFARARMRVSTHAPQLFGGQELRFESLEPGEALIEASRAPGNLPARGRFFFGRGQELVTLAKTLEATPAAAVISGVSGMGKTSLALEAAHRNLWRFPGGASFGDGRAAPLADLLLRDMALGLELPLQAGQRPEEPLLAYARQNPTLFVLDNLEDLPAADLERISRFLRGLGARSAALVTLRPPAPVFEELPFARALPLHAGLGPASAFRHLLALAKQKNLRGLQKPEIAAQLAEAGRGHPLVLEKLTALAARRPLESILASARGLSGDYKQILKVVLSWSVEPLDPGARQALACLPLFGAGSCAPESLAAALEVEIGELYRRADALRDAALLTYRPEDGRYTWHASVSDYARAALTTPNPQDALRRVVSQVCEVFDGLPASADPSTRPDLMDDLLNLYLLQDALLNLPEGDPLARLATAPRNWWMILSFHKQWLPWLQAALQKGISEDRLRANVLQAIGDVQNFRDEREAALESYGAALNLFRQVGDRLGEANVLKAIGDVQNFRKEIEAALESYGAALNLFRQVGDRLGEANVLKAIGDVQNFRKEIEAALESYGAALNLFRQVGDRLGEANVLKAIGQMSVVIGLNEQNQESFQKGIEILQSAMGLFEQINDRVGQTNVLMFLSRVAAAVGQKEQAIEIAQTAMSLLAEVAGPNHPVTISFAEYIRQLQTS